MSNGTNGETKTDSKGTVPVEELTRMVIASAISTRLRALSAAMDERRDVEEECYWPKEIDPYKLHYYYRRHPIAGRVVEVLPKETWQITPEIYEDDDIAVTTPFEAAVSALSRSLRVEPSFYEDPTNSLLWEYLKRVDIQSGIGSYGVMLLGIDDGLSLDKPAEFSPGKARRKLTFIRVYPENLAQVTAYETDVRNPRYGQPTGYNITMHDPAVQATFGATPPANAYPVHWSRVIHVADNLTSSEVLGEPRMMPVLYNLVDLWKLYGSSAEGYWKGAFIGLSLETHPSLGGEVLISRPDLREMMEDWSNGLQRYLDLVGMTAKSLAPQVVDPTNQIATQIEAICIKLGCPVRIFKGSERGELASSQDDAAWNDRLRERQNNYLTPRLIVPLIDRLILLGVLPAPKLYKVWWPDLESQGRMERADIAFKKAQALAQYVQGGVETVIGAQDFLSRVLDFTEAEAHVIVQNALANKGSFMTEDVMKKSTKPEVAPTSGSGGSNTKG